MAPSSTPGAWESVTGPSRTFFLRPYTTHRLQFTTAVNGRITDPFCQVKS